MSISSPFIHRPVGTALLTAALALAGVMGYSVLPVAPLPEVDFPTINVNASLPGASAQIMAATVATPLERQFSRIAGVTEMTSSSSLGSTSITLQFDLGRDINGAAHDVQAGISAARTYLPTNLPQNPYYRKVNPADAPILILGLSSNKYDVTQLYDMASTLLQQKISQIDGVGQIFIGGGATPAVRVEVNPEKLESFGLTLGDVQYKPLIIGYHNGQAVRLSDVANVVDSTSNVRTSGSVDGQRAVSIHIFRQPNANIIETVDRIRAQLPLLEAILPKGIT